MKRSRFKLVLRKSFLPIRARSCRHIILDKPSGVLALNVDARKGDGEFPVTEGIPGIDELLGLAVQRGALRRRYAPRNRPPRSVRTF